MSVQLPPSSDEEKARRNASAEAERLLRAQEYLDKYFEEQRIAVCWQEAREFTERAAPQVGVPVTGPAPDPWVPYIGPRPFEAGEQ